MLINLTDQSPLHVAIVSIEGHLNVVKYLVEEHAYDIAETCSDERTAVHLAVDRGHLKIVKYLIDERQADTVLADNKGYTPLHLSIVTDEFEVMELLARNGQDNTPHEATLWRKESKESVSLWDDHQETIGVLYSDVAPLAVPAVVGQPSIMINPKLSVSQRILAEKICHVMRDVRAPGRIPYYGLPLSL